MNSQNIDQSCQSLCYSKNILYNLCLDNVCHESLLLVSQSRNEDERIGDNIIANSLHCSSDSVDKYVRNDNTTRRLQDLNVPQNDRIEFWKNV